MAHWRCPNIHLSFAIALLAFLESANKLIGCPTSSPQIPHCIRVAAEVSLFGWDLLVHGVLDVLLQPFDLKVQTHLFVGLQLGTNRQMKKGVRGDLVQIPEPANSIYFHVEFAPSLCVSVSSGNTSLPYHIPNTHFFNELGTPNCFEVWMWVWMVAKSAYVALLATCPCVTLPFPKTPGRGSSNPTAMSSGEALIENRWMNRLRVEFKVAMCKKKKSQLAKRVVIKKTELTPPCQLDTRRALQWHWYLHFYTLTLLLHVLKCLRHTVLGVQIHALRG